MSTFTHPPFQIRGLIAGLLLASLTASVFAQRGTTDEEAGPEHAVIERMPLELRDPRTYQVPMHLQPVTSIQLVARLDGIINNVLVKPGERVTAQEEIVRMDSTIRQLELDRAQKAFQLAQLESNAPAEEESGDVAAARLDIARLDLRLAEERLNETIIRATFDGTITDVHVISGQFVRAGDPLVTLADLTRFTVDVPISRREVSEGDEVEVRVEDRTVRGEVVQVLPLADRFETLRDLFPSIATARVSMGGGDSLADGQTVYSDMIPRHPVAEVPTAALLNTDDGQRKVQVIREEYVRDVVVLLLGQNGEEHIFVSGRFGPADELVVEASEDLLDGTRIVPSTEAETRPSGAGAGTRPGTSQPSGF